jgi:hypothetical protein
MLFTYQPVSDYAKDLLNLVSSLAVSLPAIALIQAHFEHFVYDLIL